MTKNSGHGDYCLPTVFFVYFITDISQNTGHNVYAFR